MEQYILYARKSTDTEDKQVLSIEAQLSELRKYAKDNNLTVIDELIEKRTAKIPGRPIFNDMITRIQNGEANGILAWHPDRLARNSIDGGQIVYLLDQTVLNYLRFPMFQFENTSQGKFMLSIMFGQSKYYVDSLAENTKRGLRAKLRNGEYPSHAPFGYLNDVRTKTIIIDKTYSVLVKQAFELYARGDKKMADISAFLKENGAITKGGKTFKDDKVKWILQNPFYYGHFRYCGELYEGKHEPIISKALYDKVQAVIAKRGKVHKQYEPKVFCGLLKCECGMSITASKIIKKQKNGNRHEYIYYHCSRKSKVAKCYNLPVRSQVIETQAVALLKSFVPQGNIVPVLDKMIDDDENSESDKNFSVLATLREQIQTLAQKQRILLETYLDQDIDRQTFVAKKSEIMSEKKTLEEKLANLQRNENCWVKPMRNWLKSVNSLCEISESRDFLAIKNKLAEIYGSNLFLKDKTLIAKGEKTLGAGSQKHLFEGGQKGVFGLYSALRELNQKIRLSGGKIEDFSDLVRGAGIEPARPFGSRHFKCRSATYYDIRACTSIIYYIF